MSFCVEQYNPNESQLLTFSSYYCDIITIITIICWNVACVFIVIQILTTSSSTGCKQDVTDPVWSTITLFTDLSVTRIAVCPRWSWDRCCLCYICDCHPQAPRLKLSLPSVLGIWNCCTFPRKTHTRRTIASVFHTEMCCCKWGRSLKVKVQFTL